MRTRIANCAKRKRFSCCGTFDQSLCFAMFVMYYVSNNIYFCFFVLLIRTDCRTGNGNKVGAAVALSSSVEYERHYEPYQQQYRQQDLSGRRRKFHQHHETNVTVVSSLLFVRSRKTESICGNCNHTKFRFLFRSRIETILATIFRLNLGIVSSFNMH